MEEKTLKPPTRSESVKTYKIASYANRKDAKRHLVKSFQASSEEEAVNYFIRKVAAEGILEKYTYKLYSGDWQRCIYTYY